MTTIIEVGNVTKTFGGVVANHEISLKVEKGAITGMIGPNGSGKTTLFNSIVGYHPIDSGSIRFRARKSQNSGSRTSPGWGWCAPSSRPASTAR